MYSCWEESPFVHYGCFCVLLPVEYFLRNECRTTQDLLIFEWYKNIFGNNNTNYIKAMCQADNVPNLYSKNCNFLLSLHLEVYCFLLLLFINLRKWDPLHLQWQIYFLQKSVHTLGLSVDFQVRQIGLLKYFGNTSLYIKARVPH